jgi:hypothetical protein
MKKEKKDKQPAAEQKPGSHVIRIMVVDDEESHPATPGIWPYYFVKEIDFPWPIARIIYQHHERINGTGYPLGITGEDILIEAKNNCCCRCRGGYDFSTAIPAPSWNRQRIGRD